MQWITGCLQHIQAFCSFSFPAHSRHFPLAFTQKSQSCSWWRWINYDKLSQCLPILRLRISICRNPQRDTVFDGVLAISIQEVVTCWVHSIPTCSSLRLCASLCFVFFAAKLILIDSVSLQNVSIRFDRHSCQAEQMSHFDAYQLDSSWVARQPMPQCRWLALRIWIYHKF